MKEKIEKCVGRTIKDSFFIQKRTTPESGLGSEMYRRIDYTISFSIIEYSDSREVENATDEILQYIEDERNNIIKKLKQKFDYGNETV